MKKRPNVLWIMTDQHHADGVGYRGRTRVRTPSLDALAGQSVDFPNAFANNPICSPSRICFITGQYVHTHGMFGNNHAEYPVRNPDTVACQFRRYGYQTGLFGKSHMVRGWDQEGFEVLRYTDLTDADRGDPETTHYFHYLAERGLADHYEQGAIKPGQESTLDGSGPALLPHEHSIERYTANEALAFLRQRDESRPFFMHLSFQRPHAPIAPAAEHFDLYDPDRIELPESAVDYFERTFAGKPAFMQEKLRDGCEYPLADPDPRRLKRCLASYYALITVIDEEIGRVLAWLDENGERENTVIVFTADHGDFAGDHGLFHKNFGLYESIQRIPFLLSWPGGPRGGTCDALVESIDLYPTLCELCAVPVPPGRDGTSLLPAVRGDAPGKDAAFGEWETGPDRILSIRTRDARLVFYRAHEEGELYDRRTDPGEIDNRWGDPACAELRRALTERLLRFAMSNRIETGGDYDRAEEHRTRYSPVRLLHKGARYWSRLTKAYTEPSPWPPPAD